MEGKETVILCLQIFQVFLKRSKEMNQQIESKDLKIRKFCLISWFLNIKERERLK